MYNYLYNNTKIILNLFRRTNKIRDLKEIEMIEIKSNNKEYTYY